MRQSVIATEDLAKVRQLVISGAAREQREMAHVKRAEVAREVGVSEAAVARWEDGSRMPTGRAAIAYLHVLQRLQEVAAG